MTCLETLALTEAGLLAVAFLFALVIWGAFEGTRRGRQ